MNIAEIQLFAQSMWTPIVAICLVYTTMIAYSQQIQKEPWVRAESNTYKTLFFGWNILLTIQSLVVFVLAFMEFFSYHSLHSYICEHLFGNQWQILANGSFVFSKIVELGDTVFLVLAKKKILFLHWFHHLTVLIQCWHSLAHSVPTGKFFLLMNSGIHALMYAYYAFSVLKIKVSYARQLTQIQLSQMIFGLAVQLQAYFTESCKIYKSNALYGLGMQCAQAVLFAQFQWNKYTAKSESLKIN